MGADATLFLLAVGFGVALVLIIIAAVFFRVKERIELQKETNRLLKKIAGEQ